VTLRPRTRTTLAWALWLATMAACVAGLVVALLVARPLTAQVLLDGALYALGFPLGYATVGLVLTLRRPANPIGWLYATSALVWSLIIPLGPWVDQLVREQRPLPLLAKLDAVAEVTIWAPAIALGITLPALLVPDGRLRSPRWRVVVATAIAGPALFVVGVFLIPGPTTDMPVRFQNPLGQPGLAGEVAKAPPPPAWPCTACPCWPPCCV
jgi:two-component system NarL family sensor kinase